MTEKKCLDIQAIKDANDRQLIEIDLTEDWGGIVYIKPLSGKQRDWLENHTDEAKENFRTKAALMSVCDETGKLMFTDEDAEWLGDKGARPLEKILKEVLRVNGFSTSDVEQLEKN